MMIRREDFGLIARGITKLMSSNRIVIDKKMYGDSWQDVACGIVEAVKSIGHKVGIIDKGESVIIELSGSDPA